MSRWLICEPPWLQPHAIEAAERRRKEAAEREAKRWSKLTEEQRARELRRKERRRKVSDFLSGALLLAFLFGLTTALIQRLLDLPLLAAILFGMTLFLALWVWSIRNEVSDLRAKVAEAAPDATTGRSHDGG